MPKSSSQLYHINKNVFAFLMFYWFPIHHRAISSILRCHLEDLGLKSWLNGFKKTTKCVTRSGFHRLPHFNHSFLTITSVCFWIVGSTTADRGNRRHSLSLKCLVRSTVSPDSGLFFRTLCNCLYNCSWVLHNFKLKLLVGLASLVPHTKSLGF